MEESIRVTSNVLSTSIDVLSWDIALSRIAEWATRRESRYVCLCNVHSVVMAAQNPEFSKVIGAADMAAPDGAPIASMLRASGFSHQQRINGPDLMWRYCREAARSSESIFLYGGQPKTLALLQCRLKNSFPSLRIVGAYSPPFRAATYEEDLADIERINSSGATTVWISLGCPKQECWMAEHRGRVHAVMIGVGAAFDFHAGTLKRAPVWMQESALEWMYRLISEPRRLWKRYLVSNSIFMVRASYQLMLAKVRKNKRNNHGR